MKRKFLVVTMLAVMIVGVSVGVLVWPEPKEALAVFTTFRCDVDWEAMQFLENKDTDLITMTLRIYSDSAYLILIEEREIPFIADINEVRSRFACAFEVDLDGHYWQVDVDVDPAALFHMQEANPVNCGEYTLGQLNMVFPPAGTIHMVDQ